MKTELMVHGNKAEIAEQNVFHFNLKAKEKRIVRNIAGKELRREYDISAYINGKELKCYTFYSLRNIEFFEYWNECCDAELSSKDKKKIRMNLQKSIKELEYKECYEITNLGLLSRNPIIFAYAKDLIITQQEIISICSENLPEIKINVCVDEAELLEYASRLIYLMPGVTDVLFCIRLVCIIRPILRNLNFPADFIVALLGESGSFKTVYAKLFFEECQEQFLSFSNCNSKTVQKYLEKYSGHAVIVDDYHPLATKYAKERQQGILDLFARIVTSGEGAIGVITGEFMEGCFSLQDRIIPVHVYKKSMGDSNFSKELRLLQNENYKLNSLMFLFATKVYSKLDVMIKQLEKLIVLWGNNIYPYRIERNVNILVVAMQLFQSLFPCMNQNRIDEQMKNSFENLVTSQKRHMEVVQRLEYNLDLTNEVYHMLDSNNIVRKFDFSESTHSEGIVIKNNYIYITEIVLETEMYKFLGCHIKTADIINHLHKTQVLDEDESTSRTKKLGGKRYYVINRDLLKLYHLSKEKEQY